MKIYNYDLNGKFIGESIADKSPLEEGEYLIPALATDQKPLPEKEGFDVIWNGSSWGYVEQPKVKPEQPNEYSIWDEDLEEWVVNFTLFKTFKLSQLNTNFEIKSQRPRVEVASLGYFVDGGRTDLDNFKNGRDIAYPYIMDADNKLHPAGLSDYEAVIRAIQENGAALISWKWSKKEEINAIKISDTLTESEAIVALEEVDIS